MNIFGKKKNANAADSTDVEYDEVVDDQQDQFVDETSEFDAVDDADMSDEDVETDAGEKKGRKGLKGLKFGRSKKDGEPKRLRPDARLKTVVGTSVPGAMIDLLMRNKNFVIPSNSGNPHGNMYAILLLPTQHETFGGLSKATKRDEDKGMLISSIESGAIAAVVTPELLEEDVLGLVPNSETLENMDEYSLLKKQARYVFGIVMQDPVTSNLVVFSLPGRDASTFEGDLYGTVTSINKGSVKLSEVIDFELAHAMQALYLLSQNGELGGSEDVLDSYGVLSHAMDINNEAIMDRITETNGAKYPDLTMFITRLVRAYPALADVESYGLVDADDESRHLSYGEFIGLGVEDTDNDVSDAEDAVESHDDTDVEGAAVAAQAESEGGRHRKADAEDGVSFDGDDQGDSEQVDQAESPFGEFAPMHAIGDPIPSEKFEAVVNSVNSLRDCVESVDDRSVMQSDELQLILEKLNQLESRNQVRTSQRVFTSEEFEDSLIGKYQDETLNLGTDLTIFEGRLVHPYISLSVPDVESMGLSTPWLSDQYAVLAENLNAELMNVFNSNYNKRRALFVDLTQRAIDTISQRLSLHDSSTPYGEAFISLNDDRQSLYDDVTDRAEERAQELRDDYLAQREAHAEAEKRRAEIDFDRMNKPGLEASLDRIRPQMINEVDMVYDTHMQALNTARKSQAATMLEAFMTQIVKQIDEMSKEDADQESRLRDDAQKKLDEFVEKYRNEDLHRADVLDERNRKDNRVAQMEQEHESLLAQFNARREQADSENEDRIKRLTAEYENRIQAQAQNMAAKEAEFEAWRANKDAQVQTMLSEKEREKDATIASLETQLEQSKNTLATVKTDLDNALQSAQTTPALFNRMLIIAAFVLIIGSILGGMAIQMAIS